MSGPNPMGNVGWTVNSTVRELDPAVPGFTAYRYAVNFTTTSGAQGVVYIPESQIGDLVQVRSKVAAMAAQLESVNTLTSES